MPPSGPTSQQRTRVCEGKRSPAVKELPLCEAWEQGQLHANPHFPAGSFQKVLLSVVAQVRQPWLHFQQAWAL